jgi:hypothetical protein
MSVIALFAAAFGLFEGASRYFEQREKELRYTVTAEMIDLARQLRSEEPNEVESAALLLSHFEEHGAPVLIARIKYADEDTLPYLTSALDFVVTTERVREAPKEFAATLLRYARLTADQMRGSESPAPISNYIDVIGAVFSEIGDCQVRQQALNFLLELDEKLDAPTRFSEIEKEIIRNKIGEAIGKLEKN